MFERITDIYPEMEFEKELDEFNLEEKQENKKTEEQKKVVNKKYDFSKIDIDDINEPWEEIREDYLNYTLEQLNKLEDEDDLSLPSKKNDELTKMLNESSIIEPEKNNFVK